jgi:hypothetical protein
MRSSGVVVELATHFRISQNLRVADCVVGGRVATLGRAVCVGVAARGQATESVEGLTALVALGVDEQCVAPDGVVRIVEGADVLLVGGRRGKRERNVPFGEQAARVVDERLCDSVPDDRVDLTARLVTQARARGTGERDDGAGWTVAQKLAGEAWLRARLGQNRSCVKSRRCAVNDLSHAYEIQTSMPICSALARAVTLLRDSSGPK